MNTNPLRILQISDTHCRHRQLINLPAADVIVHCGDFSEMGTEDEILDFLNWFIELPYLYKVFVTGNHDLCLWDADDIENLPDNVYFLQDRDCEIEGIRFFGLAYNHPEKLIPNNVDVLVTHEPPVMILDESNNTHWGNVSLRNRVMAVKPHYHLFGHAHDSYGTVKQNGIIFFNGAIFDDTYKVCREPKLFMIKDIYNIM
ncbi:metallophosphatase domain-containing protein [uncultured Parabacteroides sp.]|uniref:metallophosphatase domain-containing protein n=1 Tax=uncultured Parabacteroides sp. TaxID=512312 RepID=UPI00258C05D2|nr:metallophosphatase domain-containing protein [uncultured Parabacteroides sp.]